MDVWLKTGGYYQEKRPVLHLKLKAVLRLLKLKNTFKIVRYDTEYLLFGYIYIGINTFTYVRCIVCEKVLNNSYLASKAQATFGI